MFFRKRWKINSGICQKEGNVKHKMTLTSCVGGEDFTCDDGTCVRINKVSRFSIHERSLTFHSCSEM